MTSTNRSRSRASNSTRPPTRTGTVTESSESGWIISILEGRGGGREVGLASFDTGSSRILINQFPDSPSFVKTLHLFLSRPPSIILVPMSSLSNSGINKSKTGGTKTEESMLVRCLRDAWPQVPINGVDRKYWNEQDGFEFITKSALHDLERAATISAVKSKYYALSASSALFRYLESAHSLSFGAQSVHIRYSTLQGTMLIDNQTAANLELVSNLLNKNSKQHLFGLLNHCFTPMGARLLRTNILGPLSDITVIEARLDVVEELVEHEEKFHAIRKALEPLKNLDVDKLVGQLVNHAKPKVSMTSRGDPSKEAEAKVSRLLQLRTLLHSFPALRAALRTSNSPLLKNIAEIITDDRTEEMLKIISKSINEDAISSLQKGSLASRNARIYAIRAERKLILDVARETYKENISDAYDLVDRMKEKYGFEIKLTFTTSGFTFSALQADLDGQKFPSVFTNIVRKGKKIDFSSLELKKKNSRIVESVQEIFLLSDEILNEVLEEVQIGISALFRASEAIAMLDMLASYADVASKENYVRPEFTDTLAIKAGRNPLFERFRLSDGNFVPNDTYASEAATFQLVYGFNMSGKSTLLKQIALLYIMAQIGCYVPAEYACFRVITTILSRLSNDDSIEASLSTFAKEMSTMSMIMSTLAMNEGKNQRNCLIIIDELGRGTSNNEGVGIAHAFAEQIIKSKAICFFATHFKELATTLSRYPNAVSVHLETEIDREQSDFSLTFHHRVQDGIITESHYGIELAKVAKLPTNVLDRASVVSELLESLAQQGRKKSEGTKLADRRRALLQIKSSLQNLSRSTNPSAEVLLKSLRSLQEDSIIRLGATMVSRESESVEKSEETGSEEEEEEGSNSVSEMMVDMHDSEATREDDDVLESNGKSASEEMEEDETLEFD